ncbi:hypothetical protein Pfo_020475 [Paulownia fortunei]|nr:hypothetical protein Pfo_020475 [Paulownia fortunei]
MEGKIAMARHFFKVMMPGFQEKLNLPPALSETLKEEKSELAILKSRKGMWKINVCRNSEGLICFKDGWPQFAHHHGLSIGDFVLFEHTGDLHFNAFVFDRTACEKEFLIELKKEHEEAPEAVNPNYHPRNTKREPDKESVKSYHSENPHFILTMKPHHAHKDAKVTIPAEFLRLNKLGQKSSLILRDPRRRAWPVRLLVQKTGHFRLRMDRGWHDFYVSNELKDGDVCLFDLNPHSLQSTTVLMDVQIFPAPL